MQWYSLNKRVLYAIFNSSLARALSLAIASVLLNQAVMTHIQADKQRHDDLIWWTRLNALPEHDLQKLVNISIKQQQQIWFTRLLKARQSGQWA